MLLVGCSREGLVGANAVAVGVDTNVRIKARRRMTVEDIVVVEITSVEFFLNTTY